MSHLKFLENFEGDAAFATHRPRPEDLPGFADGFAAGQAAANATSGKLNAEFINRLTEIQFGYAEARQELLHGLSPLVNALCDQILPDILDDVTRSQLVEMLLIASRSDLSKPISLTFHPDNNAIVEQSVSGFDVTVFILEQDADLSTSEIIVRSQSQETQLDTTALLDALKNALRLIVSPENRT